MAAKLIVLAALVVAANAGYLSQGYGLGLNVGNSGGGGGISNGGNNGASGNNYYNNAPLGLNHGPLPQQNAQPVVAPLRYAPNPPPLATSTSFRHQISVSHPAQIQYTTGYGYAGNYGNLDNGGASGSGNNNNNNGGNGLNSGYGYLRLNGGNGYNGYYNNNGNYGRNGY